MRFLNAILIKLCLGFILGIYLGFHQVIELRILFYFNFSLLLLLSVFRWIWKSRLIFLSLSSLLFVVLGYMTAYVHLPQNQPHHIINSDLDYSKNLSIQAEISEKLRSNNYQHKFVLDNIRIENKVYRGKVLWQISKDVHVSKLEVGQKVLLYSKLQKFQKPKNPQYFDYAGFMNNRNVYAIVYDDHFDILPENNFSISAISSKLRQNIVLALEKSGLKDRHLELMQALILGQKQAINRETYNDFAEVGIVHILAVSGLHVGIVLIIIQFILRPIRRLPKYGNTLMVLLSILGLWCFAALAGFSPSVSRASTMFTFLALSQLFRRKTNSINMLFLSALFLLLIKPQFLFEVGFQLSYAAVFAIVMLYPVFSKLYRPEYRLPKLIVDTAYVSIAAQVGVLPFQLFYFHQFPGLFLLGNVVVIPFLGILLSGGILCIVLALFNILISPIVKIYSGFLDALMLFVDWLSAFKTFLIKDIFFTKPMFLSLMFMVFLFVLMLRDFKAKQITGFLLSALIMSLVTIYEYSKVNQKSEFVLFYKPKATIIGVKQNKALKIYSDSSMVSKNDYWLKNYGLLNNIKLADFEPLVNIFKINNKQLLRIDSTGFYSPEFKADIVLLSDSPDLHLEKLIKDLNPKHIIADCKNYKSYVERWRETSAKYNVEFYSVYEKGALSFNLE